MHCHLKGLTAGAEIELSRELVVTTFATTHTIPSLGYIVWDRRNKLKEEFLNLPGDKIRDLRLAGTPVTREVRTPILGLHGGHQPGRSGQLPGSLRCANPDYRGQLHPSEPSARKNPQVWSHASRRRHRTGGSSSRTNSLSSATSARATSQMKFAGCSTRSFRPSCAERVKVWI